MGFKDRLKRLQKVREREMMITIPQGEDGSVRASTRTTSEKPTSPPMTERLGVMSRTTLSQACRRSSDPRWRESVYAEGEKVSEEIPDLSEP